MINDQYMGRAASDPYDPAGYRVTSAVTDTTARPRPNVRGRRWGAVGPGARPLVPKGAEARVLTTAQGLVVEVRADDLGSAADIVARAERLKAR